MMLAVEVEHLEAARLRDRLAEIEAEQAALEAELAVFHAEYVRRVLTVLAQVEELDARILARVADASGTASDRTAAREAHTRARRSTSELRAIPAEPAPVPPAELKRLFRDAAKRMHPDLAPDAGARSHAEAFMKRLNDAYRAGDGDAVADLIRQWDASPYGGGEPAAAARPVAGLAAAVQRAQARLDEVRDSELARLLEETMAAAAAGRDHLAELRAGAEAALAASRARLASLDAT